MGVRRAPVAELESRLRAEGYEVIVSPQATRPSSFDRQILGRKPQASFLPRFVTVIVGYRDGRTIAWRVQEAGGWLL